MLKDLDQMIVPLKVAFVAMIGLAVLCLAVLTSLHFTIDQGLATLVGIVLGFGFFAWQARTAFGNYTKSQEKQAELDRQARERRADLDYQAAVIEQTRRKNALLSAIRAEIIAVHSQVLEQISSYQIFSEMHEAMHDSGAKNTSKGFLFHSIDAPVFKANISDIGLLGVSIGADVIKVLSRAAGRENKTVDVIIDHQHLAKLYKGAVETYKEWQADLLHVAVRIRAEQEGTADPGTLLQEQSRRKAVESRAVTKSALFG